MLLIYGCAIALRSRNLFGRVLAMGLCCNLFFYVFINIAMVMGLLPVVGVPLPLISYGGTALIMVKMRAGCSARASCRAARATSTSCRRSRPTSSSPCSPRSSAWSAG